ncbi:raffinose/stachyose/melibiose transport system permease protein [Anaerocolumna jejuensis DSM 15929]|uniref:Raffinose/stachyose/melibiose transport system permease protein n=1 Tax=Anaerocolumna jejuensis DSM 15929 TaxID=1121322 RepID=A0A1M7BP69_9FIRM|nr:carbohydrate ABC transporter permease [Anaerocolumna jejuensis]SHL56727.1 raffinose/stachyose/melibiose transport system permease protein [Anaerocolumna jejuensis DSM 15929]
MKKSNILIIQTKSDSKLWHYLVAVLLIIVYLLPIYILINMSFRDVTDITSRLFLPKRLNLENYMSAFFGKDLWIGFKNSTIIVIETVSIQIVIGALAAYGLARSSGRIAEGIRKLNMGIMMIPGLALLVGTYSLMVKMNMDNSLWGLSLLSAAGALPGTIFLYANFIVAIPKSLDEAAAIDGAGVIRTFFSVIMPQLKAITVTQIIFAATGSWNNYLMPMYLLQKKSHFTIIQVIKAAFNQSNGNSNLPLACATCVLGLLPVIILYLFLQKYIIQGQIDSSSK